MPHALHTPPAQWGGGADSVEQVKQAIRLHSQHLNLRTRQPVRSTDQTDSAVPNVVLLFDTAAAAEATTAAVLVPVLSAAVGEACEPAAATLADSRTATAPANEARAVRAAEAR